jgi:hypothetical protein
MTIVDQPPPKATGRRPAWDLVIEHVEGRRSALPTAVDRVIMDMRERDQIGRARYNTPLTSGNGRDHLIDCYQESLDMVAYLAAELDEHGISPDGLIEVRAPRSAHLVRVQAILWDHVRTIVQLRELIDARESAA